jgi:predicted secreted protein
MPQLGTATVLKINGTILAKGKSVGFEMSSNMVDITNKDSAGNKQFLPGDRSATISFEGLFDETITTTAGFSLLNAAIQNGTQLTALFGAATGKTYSYAAYVSSLSRTAPEGDVETFSCSLQCTGAQTEA